MEKQIVSFLAKGTPLHKMGVNNWGLTREQALVAIEEFRAAGVPVLGGDVYWNEEGEWVPSYDNWYSNRKDTESLEDYVQRSTQVAKDYVGNYQNLNSKKALFVLVYPNP